MLINCGSEESSSFPIYILSEKYEFDVILKISEILLNDKEGLIHKAVGWMLREVGIREMDNEEEFLQEHYIKMSHMMLRYTIEKFLKTNGKMFLRGEV